MLVTIGNWLTAIGLLADLIGFTLVWKEYRAAAASTDAQLSGEIAEERVSSAPIDSIRFYRATVVTERGQGKTNVHTYQEPVRKTPEEIAREQAANAGLAAALRDKRRATFATELMSRSRTFQTSAIWIIVGFFFQGVGAVAQLLSTGS